MKTALKISKKTANIFPLFVFNFRRNLCLTLCGSLRDERCRVRYTRILYFVIDELAFLTPCDQAFNPPFLGGKIIELAEFCFKNKRFEPSLSFFGKQVIVSHCV